MSHLLIGRIKSFDVWYIFTYSENSKVACTAPKLRIHKFLSTSHFYFIFKDACKLTKQCERIVNVSSCCKCLQTKTTSSFLPASRIWRSWFDVLDSSHFHVRSSQGTQCRLSSWSWCLGAATAGSTQFDVKSRDSETLALFSDVLKEELKAGLRTCCWRKRWSKKLPWAANIAVHGSSVQSHL